MTSYLNFVNREDTTFTAHLAKKSLESTPPSRLECADLCPICSILCIINFPKAGTVKSYCKQVICDREWDRSHYQSVNQSKWQSLILCWLLADSEQRVNFPTKLLVFANTSPHVLTWWESTKSKETIRWVPQIRSPQFMAKTIH